MNIENIRSIKKQQLEFPESTILFFGDVGSGKSSVLKAIEFALFGTMGELSGKSLLRRGEKKGLVELTFDIDGKRYTIYRELAKVMRMDKSTNRKEPRITQPKGWFEENGIQTAYTTTELRLKILSILNYSISKYKSSSKKCIDIFRYTVYAPQEEIKAILLADLNERFEILKDVLEIEKYENVLKNLETIKGQLRSDLREIQAEIKAIGDPEEEITKKEKQIEEQDSIIKSKMKEVSSQKSRVNQEKETLEKIQEEYQQYSNKSAEIHAKRKSMKEDTDSIEKNDRTLKKLTSDIANKKKEFETLPDIELKTNKKENELESELQAVRNNIRTVTETRAVLQKKINDVDKLLKEGKCSLCGQKIHEKERFNTELKETKDKLKEADEKLKAFNLQIEKNESLLKNIREYEKYAQKRQNIQELIKEKESHQMDLIDVNKRLEDKRKSTAGEILSILKSYNIKNIKEFINHENQIKKKLKSQKQLLDDLQSDLTKLEKELSTHETHIKTLEKELDDLKNQSIRKQKLSENHEFLNNLEDWVSDQLPLLIKDIERTILNTTAVNFNLYFKDWFRALVEDENIDIQIDPENFQPIVMINDFESPFDDMSGGEKSALSLAYRLALNKVINVKHQDVKTKDLLILDEPTDGFSEDQVNKMQDVFEKLNTKQMIIISHERTLDSFVTDIYDFKKVNHETKITREKV
jgi:exonuclease SbcC